MLNSDNADFKYQLSGNNCDIHYFDRVSFDCDYSKFSWDKVHSNGTDMKSSHTFNGVILNDSIENQTCNLIQNQESEFIKLLMDDIDLSIESNSVEKNTSVSRISMKPPKVSKRKIISKSIKALMTNEVLSQLPYEERQHLVSLMPDCDKIVHGHATSLSKTAMDNEFFNRALMRFIWKLTNGKSILSSEAFVNRIRSSVSTTKLTTERYLHRADSDDGKLKPNSDDIQQSTSSSTNRLDYYINEAKVNYDFGVESPVLIETREYGNQRDAEKSNGISSSNYLVDNSFQINVDGSGDSYNISNDSECDTFQNQFANILSTENSQTTVSTNCDLGTVLKSGKYKRRNSDCSLTPSQKTRPSRSTAGQLPARLKSSSPQLGSQGTIMSALLYRSQSPKVHKSPSGRKKNKEKRNHKTTEHNNPNNGHQESKPTTFHNDTILSNLRSKLSKRIQKNSVKDFPNPYSRLETTLNLNPEIDCCFNSKSPVSLSPESDKLPFVDSPLSKNIQNNFRHLKFRNQYFDNQTPTSPQWSFSSEFTSQSSVESVLSQKNIKIELEEVSVSETLLDDMDTEEMPPPRRTLTVAAMREKMRAKKMAKEEKRKDFDKDFSFDVDRIDDSKTMDMLEKQSQCSSMSNMMGMCQDNDDDNIANEFDSFLIDDYHEEIDDKILNYSDDLDDLLLSGGNESLLEIIMKDPDAMDIGNDGFGTLNSDNQHRNPMVSSDQAKTLFPDTHTQSHCNAFNVTSHNHNGNHTTDGESGTNASTINHKPSPPVSSVCRLDNSILSKALTSVIQKSDSSKSNSKESSANKSALQNAYLVDGNGLSDALKLIQSLHPSAKVTTQQFYLVNSGPQLVLSQAPPNQATTPSRPISAQTPIKSAPVANNHTTPVASPIQVRCEGASRTSNVQTPIVITNTKPSIANTQSPVMSSTLSVLPQFSAFNTKPTNIYSLNSNIGGCKFPQNSIQFQSPVQSMAQTCSQSQPIFTTQKPITLAQNNQNPFGIRLQLAQNFPNGQQLNIIQPSSTQMMSTLMNQSVQFISQPQSNNASANNISLITQTQPMSKFVFLYPNLNCSTEIKADPQQQLILLSSQPSQDQIPATPTFQVLNSPNIWQQITSPSLGTFLGNPTSNNLVLMNPQALGNQSFAFNYHQQSPLITTTGSNLLMMSTAQGHKVNNMTKIITSPTSSLSVSVSKPDEDNISHNNTSFPNSRLHMNVNSNSSQNSCIEQLSNSSSSANSKLSFDDKLSKGQSAENFTDSDQEKSINSPQFQLLNTSIGSNGNQLATAADQSGSSNHRSHLTVDIDSPPPPSSNSFYPNNNNNNNGTISIQSHPTDDLDTDYDQSDFEIPCLYSSKIDVSVTSHLQDIDSGLDR